MSEHDCGDGLGRALELIDMIMNKLDVAYGPWQCDICTRYLFKIGLAYEVLGEIRNQVVKAIEIRSCKCKQTDGTKINIPNKWGISAWVPDK